MSETWHIDARALRPAMLEPPLSKSDAQRALVLDRILRGTGGPWLTLPDLAGQPNDVQILAAGLAALDSTAGSITIDCEDGGTPFRTLLGQAAISAKSTTFVGTSRLAERPHQSLLDSLERALGPAGFSYAWRKPWPLVVNGTTASQEPIFRVRASESSQFVTSLMLAAAALSRREGRAWTVAVDDVPASAAYLDITRRWLERAGFEARPVATGWSISWTCPSIPASVPGDWSSIGYLLLAAWKSGSVVSGVDESVEHPDAKVVAVLRAAGLSVEISGGRARVEGSVARGIQASGEDCPDLLPTLAALACVCPAASTLSQVEILRVKESDRLEGIRSLLRSVGAESLLEGDRLIIRPLLEGPETFRFDSRGDHRLAMAAGTLAALLGARLELTEPRCVRKSFPGFWEQLERSGVIIERNGSPP